MDDGLREGARMIEWDGVSMRYGATEVLRSVSMRVTSGERVALIGPNGAGKSTLFHLASGLGVPVAGRILLDGRRIDGLPPQHIHRLGLARSFQTSSLFAGMSAFENLRCAALRDAGAGCAFWKRIDRIRPARERAVSMLDRLGLANRAEVPAGQLGHAEQRLLEIGMATIVDAHTVLLDEPTAGLNASQIAHVVALIRSLTAGRTLLLVEHDMGVVFDLADRVAVLVRGELIAFASPQAVRADARVQQAYLGALDVAGR
jgi:branched-chain amino acid transport system ATP-binding protein